MAGSSHVLVVRSVFLPEGWIILDRVEALLKLGQAVHQRLRNILATKLAESLRDLAMKSSKLGHQSTVLLGSDIRICNSIADSNVVTTGLPSSSNGFDKANLSSV
ncbi:hypothetical protein HG531_011106 [Fusarium graminearum]|nr:hypothetical protein HG531_011106 [Fusarium graminearum]